MKTGTDRITVLQLFIVMMLSRIIVSLLYIPGTGKDFHVTDLVLQVVIAAVILVITAIPVRLLMGDTNNNGFLERCNYVSPVFGKISALLILVSLIFLALRVIMRFEIFTTTVIFPQSDIKFFLVITILACLYCVVMGLDVLGRTAEIFFTIVILSIVFILVATVNQIEFTNFTPVLYGSSKSVVKSSLYSTGVTIELIYPLILKDKVEGKKLPLVYPWILITFGFIFLLEFWQAGVLGDYAETQLFPFFALTSMTNLGFLERLDAILTAAWVVCEFVKLCMYIYIGGKCITTVFTKVKRNEALCVSAIALSLITLFSQDNYNVNRILTDVNGIVVVYITLVIVLPIILLISERLVKKNSRKPKEESQIV